MKRFRLATFALVSMAVCALGFLFITGAPTLAQSPLPFFILNSQTKILATITLANGNVVVVPIDLTFTTRSEEAGVYMFLDANPVQPENTIVEINDSFPISASVQAIVYNDIPTPIAVVAPTNTPMPAQPVPTMVVVAPTTAALTIAAPTPTSTVAPVAEVVTQTYGIGDDVMTGDIKWRVMSAEDLGNTLVSDNESTDDATTGGRFIRVIVEIDNRGADPLTYWSPEMLDSLGRTFSTYSGQSSFVPDEQECILLTLNPGLSKQCTEIYEVAGDAQGLKLKVSDSALLPENEAIIELQ